MNTTTIPLVDVLTEQYGINRVFQVQPSNTESGYITDLEFLELLEYIHSTLQNLYSNSLYIPDFTDAYVWRWLSTSGELDFDHGTWSYNYGDNLIPLVHKEGKLLKRIRAALKSSNNKLNLQMRIRNPNTGYWGDYIPLKVEVPNNVMGLWGDKLKEIVARNNQFFCAIETDLIDGWQPGDFGDSGSCYWDPEMYEKARYALAAYPGAFAIKFYTSNHRGEGRAWVVPHPDIPNSLVMFNVYPRSNSKYTYNSTGTVMAHILQSVLPDTTYTCTKTDMYDRGILYINNGCLVVHPVDAKNVHDDVDLYGLEVPESYHATYYSYCHDCHDRLSEDEIYTSERGYDFCEHCYNARYFHCTHCDEETWRDAAININDELYCEDCANSEFSYCEHCESYVDTSEYNTATNMCYDCTSDHFTMCEICEHWIDNDTILNQQKSSAGDFRYNVCPDCYNDHLCSSCGSFNYSYNPNWSDICVHCPTLEGIE